MHCLPTKLLMVLNCTKIINQHNEVIYFCEKIKTAIVGKTIIQKTSFGFLFLLFRPHATLNGIMMLSIKWSSKKAIDSREKALKVFYRS